MSRFKKISENVENVQTLPDRPRLPAQELKAELDKGSKIIKRYFDEQVDDLNNFDSFIDKKYVSKDTKVINVGDNLEEETLYFSFDSLSFEDISSNQYLIYSDSNHYLETIQKTDSIAGINLKDGAIDLPLFRVNNSGIIITNLSEYKLSNTFGIVSEISSELEEYSAITINDNNKGLSTNDFTNEEKNKLDNLANIKIIGNNLTLNDEGRLDASGGSGGSTNYNDLSNKPKINNIELYGNKNTSDLGLFSGNYNDLSNKPTIPTVPTNLSSFTDDLGSSPVHSHNQYLTQHQDISGKVDKITGKGLSTNDYTTTEKNKLAGLSNYDDTEVRSLISAKYSKPNTGIPKTDLASTVKTSLEKADTALQSYTETDPTVPSHVKNITQNNISSWNSKAESSDIPTKVSELTNDSGFINSSYHDSAKQDTLISGTNIKTINNQSLLGSGNINIQGGGGTSDHSQLTNLDFEHSGHTGFASSNDLNNYTKTENLGNLALKDSIDYEADIINKPTKNIITAHCRTDGTYTSTTESARDMVEELRIGDKLTIDSNYAIRIGEGVTKVKVCGQLYGYKNTATNSVGVNAYVRRNRGSSHENLYNGRVSLPKEMSSYFTIAVPTKIIEVQVGDSLQLGWWKSSADSFTFKAGANSFLTVEVVE